jgi:hypothetical protein
LVECNLLNRLAGVGRRTSNGGYDQVEFRLDLGDSSELHFQLPFRSSETLFDA